MSRRNYTQLKEECKRWNCFSKIDTEGIFDFCTYAIGLEEVLPEDTSHFSLEDFSQRNKDELTAEAYASAKRVLPLVVHEYTHFVDATSTLWGFRHMQTMNNAYLASRQDEREFKKFKIFYDHLKRLDFPKYYNTTAPSANVSKPWAWDLTGGLEFNSNGQVSSRPIMFIRFFTVAHEEIARKPLTILSMLETSAMAEEMSMNYYLLRRLNEGREVEEKVLERTFLDHIYDSNLTEYSACAHLLANTQNCSDLIVAMRSASVISKLVLNAPDTAFSKAGRNLENFYRKFGVSERDKQVTLIKHALKNINHGALFYLVTMMLPRGSLASSESLVEGLRYSLSSLGIPLENYLSDAQDQVNEILKCLRSSRIDSIRVLSESGYKNFNIITGKPLHTYFDKLDLPPVYLGDMSQYCFFAGSSNKLKDLDIDVIYEELSSGRAFTTEFGDACF